ncbi:hypothetical protein BDD12DRAFT_883297 [Trichophaea hybrida]|nr:hypothetical protein BDD12DRAFT_883297 [Trichophaea hybrida]
MNNWRWDNPLAFGDKVDRSNPQATIMRKVKCTGERVSWYGSDYLRAKNEQPSCLAYELGGFLAVRPLHWEEIIDEDDDDENWADPGAPRSGSSCPGDSNDNDNSEGEEDTPGGEKGTGKGKGKQDGQGKGKVTEGGKGKWKGKGKGNGKGKVAEGNVAGRLGHGGLTRADHNTDSTEEDGEYYSEHDSDVNMHMEDDVDAPDGVDLDGDVDMERNGDDKQDEEEEDEKEEDKEDENKEENEDEVLGLVTPQQPRPSSPTLREAEAAGNISDVNVEQQLLGESAGGDSLLDVSLLDDPLPDDPLPDVPIPNVPSPHVHPDGLVAEE